MDSRSGESALGNGIDAAAWRKMVREATNLRESLGIDPKHFVIGLIGRLVHEKQQVSVLRALSCHLRDRNVVHVLVIGDGPQRSELRKLVETLAWEDRVHVLGFVDDMPAVYSTLDLLLMASIRESQSMVIIEAMASGVPIVATTVGSTPWLLANGAGWLFSPFDPKGLNEAIQALRKESELRQDLIARARSRVETHFDSTAMARKYMDRLYYPALGHDPIAQDSRNP
jgi:glycosyltransferase involved in cell wall biosynthesis